MWSDSSSSSFDSDSIVLSRESYVVPDDDAQQERPDVTPETPQDKPEVKTINLTSFEQLNQSNPVMNSHAGACSRSSIVKIESSYVEIPVTDLRVNFPGYPRISVLKDGSYFLTYQAAVSANNGNGHSTYYAVSKDLKKWEYKGALWRQKFVTNSLGKEDSHDFTNANHIVLKNGNLLVVSSYRSVGSYTTESAWLDHGLVGKISTDNGKTWGNEFHLFHGPNWESHLVELPNGDIHCYFAYPRPWVSSSNSGTALVISKDGGKTWEPSKGEYPYFVMRSVYWSEAKKQYLASDQMPVGVLLNGTDQFAFAVEVVKSYTSSKVMHGVSVVFSPEDGNWVYLTEDQTVPANCERIDNLDNNTDGIGPFIAQFPSGETVLTYTRGTNSKLMYRMGNEKARGWQNECTESPFPKYGGWSSCAIEGGHTMLMANKYSQDGTRGIAVARFALNHDMDATERTATADGDNSEWKNTDDALYVVSGKTTSATVRCSQDAQNVYFLVEVSDKTISSRDNVRLALSPKAAGDVTANGAVRMTLVPDGRISVTRYQSGRWNTYESAAVCAVSYEGTIDDNSDEDKGYFVEVSIPKSELALTDGEAVFNPWLYDAVSNKTGKLDNLVYIKNL